MWDSMFPLLFQQKNLLTQVNVGTIIFVKVLYDLQKKKKKPIQRLLFLCWPQESTFLVFISQMLGLLLAILQNCQNLSGSNRKLMLMKTGLSTSVSWLGGGRWAEGKPAPVGDQLVSKTCLYLCTYPAPGIILFTFPYFSLVPYVFGVRWGRRRGHKGEEKRRNYYPFLFRSTGKQGT